MNKKDKYYESDESDEEYTPENQESIPNLSKSKNLIKRKRSKSESDIFFKIIERCKEDNYFKNQNKNKQIEILMKEEEINNYYNTETPIKYKILFSSLPLSTKFLLVQKIDQFNSMNDDTTEYHKLYKWIKGLSLIPFDIYINMPISISDNSENIQKFLLNSFEILEKTIYGQKNVKSKMMEILAQWISNPNSITQIIALEGPPGVGKTSLIKNGVSKALHRPFCFYALGGAQDVTNLEGHSYTYEGASWGKLIEFLMETKVMNPIIFFDELDKISNSFKGKEIINLLIHLTDPSQNNTFSDKYYSEIQFDFSKILIFFSFNDIDNINPILKDRLTIVKFDSYTNDDKINIVKKFIVPEIIKNIGFNQNDIILNDDIIKYLIINYTYNEDGVRYIKRIIENLFLKLNLIKLMKKNININCIDYCNINITFPLIITIDIINKLLKNI
jgi:ATP-dependent Lon protease